MVLVAVVCPAGSVLKRLASESRIVTSLAKNLAPLLGAVSVVVGEDTCGSGG